MGAAAVELVGAAALAALLALALRRSDNWGLAVPQTGPAERDLGELSPMVFTVSTGARGTA